MSDPLLATKMIIPRERDTLVSRQRLLHHLDDGLRCKLTVLSAPAGFGKTTLLSEWVNSLNPHVKVAWLTLDEGDNEIAEYPPSLVLVLDDYHLIEAQAVHTALNFLLDHQPPQLHFFIATRADPPLHLALLRGRGQLNELRLADLCFTTEESATFLNQVLKLELNPGDIAALSARVERSDDR